MKRLAVISCLCAAVSPALAEDSVTACLMPAADVTDVTEALQSDGWMPTAMDNLADATLNQLAWMRVVQFLKTGDGGESVRTIYDIQRKSVEGLARKVDLSTSKTRVLTRADATAFVSWRISAMGTYELDCAFTGLSMAQGDRISVSRPVGSDLTITETSFGYTSQELK